MRDVKMKTKILACWCDKSACYYFTFCLESHSFIFRRKCLQHYLKHVGKRSMMNIKVKSKALQLVYEIRYRWGQFCIGTRIESEPSLITSVSFSMSDLPQNVSKSFPTMDQYVVLYQKLSFL